MTIRDMSFGYICIFTESVKSERKIAKAKKNKGKVSNELEEIRLALVLDEKLSKWEKEIEIPVIHEIQTEW